MSTQDELNSVENQIKEAESQNLTQKLNKLLKRKLALERKLIEMG